MIKMRLPGVSFLFVGVYSLVHFFGRARAELCHADCVGSGAGEVCTFKFRLNIHAGDTGYYEVEGCSGVQPTLALKANVKYVFDQTDETNWFHPLGFAYGPDGVYADNLELEKFISAPSPSEPAGGECTGPCTFTQFPQYLLNGEKLCDDSPCADEDFGLDQYEGVWFSGGRDDWLDAGNFTVELTITDPNTEEFFYFCHIHNQMSGRIKVFDDNVIRNENDLIPIEYEYDQPDAFEESCGVFNISQFQKNKACPEKTFLCGDDSDSTFGKCMNAIDCAMHEEMRTELFNDPTVVFMHQMIAHHRNAVNMAKILLKLNPASLTCGTNYDGRRLESDFCGDSDEAGGQPVVTLLWEIINGQNAQITFMEAWLKDNDQPSHDWCPEEKSIPVEYISGMATLGGALLVVSAVAFCLYRKRGATLPSKELEAIAEVKQANI